VKTPTTALLISFLLLGGCNDFAKSYKPAAINVALASYSGKTEVAFSATSENLREAIKVLASRGYVCLGTSSFTTTNEVTVEQIQTQGEKVGADVVLWERKFVGTESFYYPASTSGDVSPSGKYGRMATYIPAHTDIKGRYKYTAFYWRKAEDGSAAASGVACTDQSGATRFN
jgi:hypothetical protein